jgi:hypothetical protein
MRAASLAAVGLGLAVLSACSKPVPAEKISNDEILAELGRRLGAHPCCGDDGKPTADARQLFVLVRNDARGEAIACGWAGFRPIRLKSGETRRFPPSPFIVRERTLFLERDRTPAEFAYWQDVLCGPQWIKRLGG